MFLEMDLVYGLQTGGLLANNKTCVARSVQAKSNEKIPSKMKRYRE
jgi:hypothetical protein